MKKYYIAYGSNMDLEQMAFRCPRARLLGTGEIADYELLFKGSLTGAYATVEAKEESRVPVLVWEIEETDEKSLDRYEGYPRLYDKREIPVAVDGKELVAMIYLMDKGRKYGIPSAEYYGTLESAYVQFGFDRKLLRQALKKSSYKE